MSQQKDRILTYDTAIQEALYQEMESNPRVIIIGQGVKSPWYVGRTTEGLYDTFGKIRVIDTPVSENGMTGMALGAALAGMRPIIIHPRMDFMLYAADQIVNEAANWNAMFGGAASMPVVIRAIINRGGEQGAQHSQALHAWFAHVPGLKVVMPATPYDAKGLLIAALRDNNPVMYIDDRWLYSEQGHVPQEPYEVPIGKANIVRKGKDITLVAISYLLPHAMDASQQLAKKHIDVEVVDIRSLSPLDTETILRSVQKTGKLAVADPGWRNFGASAEIIASIVETPGIVLASPPVRITLQNCPAPVSKALEKTYYPGTKEIIHALTKIINIK